MQLLGVAVALCLLAWCESALACSCHDDKPIVPDGARDVPANTKIWIPEKRAERLFEHHLRATPESPPEPSVDEAGLREAMVLRGPAGEVSELRITSLELSGLGLYFVVTPARELAPGRYALLPRVEQTAEQRRSWGQLAAEFEVGPARSEAPLPPPVARVARWDNEDHGSCGRYVGAKLEISPLHWLLVYLAVDPSKPNDPKTTREAYALASSGGLWFGDGSCSHHAWDFSDSSALVRFGTLDYAGKFSGYGPALKLDAPWSPAELYAERFGRVERRSSLTGCACRLERQRGAEPGAGVWLLLIAALVLRRRT